MPLAKQISVGLVNKPGRLAAVLDALSAEKVNIQALAVMDAGDRSRLRFISDDAGAAAKALEALNIRAETAEVLLVEVANQPGAFAKICQRLAAEHLNIDYAYCSTNANRRAKGGALAVIKVNNLPKAQRVLSEPPATNHRAKPRPLRRPVHAR